MQKRKLVISACLILSVLTLSFSVQFASAKTRIDLMGDFLVQNQTTLGGFKNSPTSSSQNLDPFVSHANVFVLSEIGNIDDINKVQAESWFNGEMDAAMVENSLVDLYFALHGYTLVGGSFNSTEEESKVTYITGLQDETEKGFKAGYSNEPNIVDTHYAVELLDNLNALEEIFDQEISDFLLNKWDNTLGGFREGDTESISVFDTYYALATLTKIGRFSDLTSEQKSNITDTISAYLVDKKSAGLHYGGYSYSQINPQSSIVLTYYCLAIYDLLSDSIPQSAITLDWLLSRQNTVDYGFSDVNKFSSSGSSSARLTYFAFRSILLIEPEAQTGILNTEIWELSVSTGALAAIIVGIVGGIVIIIAIYWRYRNRMRI